jgi:RNA polymerase sigma factor (sigma-70 family)
LIWQRYFQALVALARRKLAPRLRRREDEEDVVQSMYKSFCLRQQRGDFDLENRDDLWKLLVTMTFRKVRNLVQRQGRARRDYRREQAGALPAGTEEEGLLEILASKDPTPEDAAILAEEVEQRLAGLTEPLRQIALWKLQGYTNEEIAGPKLLDCSQRTVERKLERIRHLWGATPAELEDLENPEKRP